MNTNPDILLVGAGAVGTYYCGRLQQAGADVSVIARSDFDAVKKYGYSIKSCAGDFDFIPSMVIKKAEEYGRAPDYIIVSTKVLPYIDVPSLIRPAVAPETSIVLLQNGINIEEEIFRAFPSNEIISGLAFICVSRISPREISHIDYGRAVFGRYPGGASAKAGLLCSMLNSSGVSCETDDDVVSARWKKLVWNAPFNPMSVLAGGADTNEMLTRAETSALAENVMKEVFLLAGMSGHPLPHDIVENNIRATLVMKPYKTSMLLDYENHREMEVEAILGNAVRIADRLGAEIPHIRTMYALLSLLNKKNMAINDGGLSG